MQCELESQIGFEVCVLDEHFLLKKKRKEFNGFGLEQ